MCVCRRMRVRLKIENILESKMANQDSNISRGNGLFSSTYLAIGKKILVNVGKRLTK